MRHALRNAIIPTITIVGLQLGYLLSGSFVIENVFAWPGVGRLAIQAIFWRDYPVIQAVVLVTGVLFLAINLAMDVLYRRLDPRIRYAGR
jgi:peptide/nickel transport system permease protein